MDTVASRRPDDVDVKPPSPPDTVLSIPDLPPDLCLHVPSPHDAALPTPIELPGPPPPPPPPPPPGSYPQQQPPPPEYYQQPPPPGYYQPPPPGYYQQPPPGYYQQPPPGYTQQQPPPGYYYYGPPPPPQQQQPPNAGGRQGGRGSQPAPQPDRRAGWDSNERFFGSFNDPEIRSAFIRKVYSILTLQMLVTTGIISFFIFYGPAKDFIRAHILLVVLAAVIQFVVGIVLVCFESVSRKVPLNFVLLTIFTLGVSYVAAAVSAQYNTTVVMMAFGLTALVTIIVTIVATLPCFDMTKYGGILYILFLVLMVFGLVIVVVGFFYRSKLLYLIYSGLAVLLFTAYLLYDTQLILGGRTVELTPEEYILGAISLYTDILQIFMHLLPLINSCMGD